MVSPTVRRLSWRKKLAYSVLTTLAFYTAVEGLLAGLGVAPLRERESDPFLRLQSGIPLFIRRGDDYETNPVKLTFFNRQQFPAVKGKRAVRIFCLGESTTYGHPFDHQLSYPAWLSAYLTEHDPRHDWQVINCGGISYASYRLAQLLEELLEYEPDLFVIYVGHNEFLEERTYRELKQQNPAFTLARNFAGRSRLAGWMKARCESWTGEGAPPIQLAAEVDTILERGSGPEAYQRDPGLQAGVLAHYRFSLEKMVRQARAAGAEVLLVQPACNLRDFSPFKAEPGLTDPARQREWEELVAAGRQAMQADDLPRARERLGRAVSLDPLNASGWWFLGHACLAATEHAEAFRCLQRAKDEDVCPLRALTSIQQIVREVADREQVEWIDFPQMLQQRCRQELGHDVVGLECFLDHVHPTSEAHADLGRELFRRVLRLHGLPPPADLERLQQRVSQQVQGKLTGEYFGLALHRLAMTLSWAGKNAEALRIAEATIEILPKYSEAYSQRGRIQEKLGDSAAALADYRQAVALNADDSLAWSRLGGLLVQQGELKEAQEALEEALRRTPERAPRSFRYNLHLKLGDCATASREVKVATRHYEAAMALDPESAGARERLQRLRELGSGGQAIAVPPTAPSAAGPAPR